MIDEVLGKVSAYAYAVEKGYTGTEEQFAYDLAHAADYASTAGAAAEDAAESEKNAKDSEEAAGQSETNAEDYAQNAHDDAAAALEAKGQAIAAKNDAVSAKGLAENYATVANNAKIAAAQSEQNASQSAESASDDAEAASNSASSASANSLKSEGFAVGEQNGVPVESGSPYYENNAKYYCEEAAEQLTLVTNEGTRQIGLVTDEGTAQKAAVQEKGEQTLESIPEDYTTLSNDVSSLKSDLNAVNRTLYTDEAVSISSTASKYWNNNNGVAELSDSSSTYWRAANALTVVPGEIYKITACQGNSDNVRVWYIVDSSYNIIESANNNKTSTGEKTTSLFHVPENGAFLLITYYNGTVVDTPRITVSKEQDYIYRDRGLLQSLGYTALTSCIMPGWYRTGTAYTDNITDLPVDFVRTSFNLFVARPAFANENFATQKLTDSNNNKWVRIIQYTNNAWSVFADWQHMPDINNVLYKKYLIGKKLSVMGASESSYNGYVPEGNDYYYPRNGVTNVNQMWWNVLCSETGMTPLVINAWSGSAVTQLEDSQHIDRVPMSADSRCSNLGTVDANPDIIILMGGTNDYTYSQSAQSEPLAWDGKTVPVIGNSFTEAYACMIKKVQQNYPNAIVICVSTLYTGRGTDNGYTWTHTSGSNVYTQEDYDRAIESVAQKMRVPYICVNNIGFNRNNYYPTYCQDSQTEPTHPNAAGHAVMGKAIAAKLIEVVKGFM